MTIKIAKKSCAALCTNKLGLRLLIQNLFGTLSQKTLEPAHCLGTHKDTLEFPGRTWSMSTANNYFSQDLLWCYTTPRWKHTGRQNQEKQVSWKKKGTFPTNNSVVQFRILHTWMLTSSLHCLRESCCRTFTLGTTYKWRGMVTHENNALLTCPPNLWN